MTDVLQFLEGLPPGLLYVAITVLAGVENVFPPVPADTAVALGAFLAGRGTMNPWVVFGLTWAANVSTAAAVYLLARRHGRTIFAGRLGKRLLPPEILDRIAAEYHRHGEYGIFLSRLLPVWRAVVCPFAGMSGLSAPRTIVPVALASGVYYGGLTLFVYEIGGNLEQVLAFVRRLNTTLAGVAVGLAVLTGWLLWRRARTN